MSRLAHHPSTGRTFVTEPQKYPFIFDTGATCIFSPERSDFNSLKPCTTHPVKGLFGSCIHAVGIGPIDLHLDAGRTLSLHDILFSPRFRYPSYLHSIPLPRRQHQEKRSW